MSAISPEKQKARALALWLLPQYLNSPNVDLATAATIFGQELISKLGLRALNALVTAMQYTLAGIETTTE